MQAESLNMLALHAVKHRPQNTAWEEITHTHTITELFTYAQTKEEYEVAWFMQILFSVLYTQQDSLHTCGSTA